MIYFLLLILAGIGITNLVVNASLFDYPRDIIINNSYWLGKLVTCMMCSGFWVGIIVGAFSGYNPIYMGATISLLSYILSKFTDYIDVITALKASELESIVEEDDSE